MLVGIAIFYHEGDQRGMVIVYMDQVWLVFPGTHPVYNGYLEGSEPFRII